ncbi:NPCBM/NEW2 domain-containing protein [Streptomyces sp. NPDC056549]|uniref:NPCBM/NEW2 domain-containing protein n=1 Tax=Streptomyces sp. NPDC056549 TaxID=3345864 RepID=UPI0036C7988D
MRRTRKRGYSPSRRLRALATSVTTAGVLAITAACGGGGGSDPTQVTRTVTVTKTAPETSIQTEPQSTSPASKSQYLSELEPLTSTAGVDASAAEINGKGFARSVTLTANAGGPVGSAEYHLGRQWKAFYATVGLRDDSPSGGALTFEVTVDGTQKYREEIALGESKIIKLGVANALRLKLSITYTGESSDYYYGSWGDAKLEGSVQ